MISDAGVATRRRGNRRGTLGLQIANEMNEAESPNRMGVRSDSRPSNGLKEEGDPNDRSGFSSVWLGRPIAEPALHRNVESRQGIRTGPRFNRPRFQCIDTFGRAPGRLFRFF